MYFLLNLFYYVTKPPGIRFSPAGCPITNFPTYQPTNLSICYHLLKKRQHSPLTLLWRKVCYAMNRADRIDPVLFGSLDINGRGGWLSSIVQDRSPFDIVFPGI